jgi:hypothetical protein
MIESIMETHLDFVQKLKDRGEIVLQPKVEKPMDHIDGYIKTQIPHKDAGHIFKDKYGTFGLFGDMGYLHVTGIKWEDLGLCNSRCWYEWMDTESYEEDKINKYSNLAVQNALNIRACDLLSEDSINDAFIEEAAESIQSVIHLRRSKCGINDLFGEMADLQIELNLMKIVFGQYEFDKIFACKYAELKVKLDAIDVGMVIK